MKNNKNILLFLALASIMVGQDMVSSYQPRFLTRGKLWTTYRSNGLMGGGNRAHYSNNDQVGLEYPGNAARAMNDFMEYWLDVEAYLNGDPNLIDVSRVTNSQNSKGSGVWILTVADGDTMVSHSGPRGVTDDIDDGRYPITSPDVPEHFLGDTTGPNMQQSNYSYYHTNISGSEAVEIHNYRYGKYIPNDEYPEEIIISQWETGMDVTVTKKAYAWSYQDYDDFIIEEIIFENTGSKNLEETYFAVMNSFSVSSMGSQWASGYGQGWGDWRHNGLSTQDDWFLYTKALNYVADNPESTMVYKGLNLAYQRDDDWLTTPWDDTGAPFKEESARMNAYNEYQGQHQNQLMAFPYIACGQIDVMPPFVNDPDEIYVSPESGDEPYAFRWWYNGDLDDFEYDEPAHEKHTPREMFDMMIHSDEGSISDNPDSSTLGSHAFVYGPYSLSPGEKAKIVMAYVGGSGADWQNEDEFTWSTTDEARDELFLGEHSVVRNFKKAQQAYDLGFDLPDPPPDVDFSFGNSLLGEMIINWDAVADTARDPDYEGNEAQDVVAYRIYRSWPPSFDWHWGPWEFLAEIAVGDTQYFDASTGKYSYTDDQSFAGYNYYYSVRTVDSGHDDWVDRFGVSHGSIPPLESGMASPEQKNMIAKSPYQPSHSYFDEMSEKIMVVPNPYRMDFKDPLHMYPDVADPYKLRFINLPRHCIIRVYSASGDLVLEKVHDKDFAAETSWRQETVTFSGRIVSGIYFWVVESMTSESMGQIQKGTLAVVK